MDYLVVILSGLFLGRGRTPLPWSERPGGVLIRRVPLPLIARLRMHARPAALLLGLTAVGWLVGRLSPLPVALVALAVVGLLALSVGYTVTSEGIAIGRRGFRRWTEFGGVARRPGGARLQGVTGRRGMTIWLSGSRDDDDFVLLLRHLVRGSYQGHLGSSVDGTTDKEAWDADGIRRLKPARVGRS